MKIYVASSWRNDMQQGVVAALREAGHEVYDFKNPRPGDHGFHWSEIDPEWKQWTPEQFRPALLHPIAEGGFRSDWDAMRSADAGVLVLPCGRSAHIEAGYFVGAGKPLVILLAPGEPELMYKMATAICLDIREVVDSLKVARSGYPRQAPVDICIRKTIDGRCPFLGPAYTCTNADCHRVKPDFRWGKAVQVG